MKAELLVETTKTFLINQFNTHTTTTNNNNNTTTNNTTALKLPATYPPVIISLSGGVDSMVIVRILIYLRTTQILPLSDIIAVHIDYANRAESGKEADFLEAYCHRHNLKFEKRVVSEVTRGITDRQEYERVARGIRYSFYEQV